MMPCTNTNEVLVDWSGYIQLYSSFGLHWDRKLVKNRKVLCDVLWSDSMFLGEDNALGTQTSSSELGLVMLEWNLISNSVTAQKQKSNMSIGIEFRKEFCGSSLKKRVLERKPSNHWFIRNIDTSTTKSRTLVFLPFFQGEEGNEEENMTVSALASLLGFGFSHIKDWGFTFCWFYFSLFLCHLRHQ